MLLIFFNQTTFSGESVPELKSALLPYDEEFSADVHRRHVLFSGTQVIQTRYYGNSRVTAVVIRTGGIGAFGSSPESSIANLTFSGCTNCACTNELKMIRVGFSTAKGALVRSILYSQPTCFKFYRGAVMFVLLLFAVASVGMIFTLYLYIKRHVRPHSGCPSMFYCSDCITLKQALTR